jgi:hypothetical protein
MSTTNGSLEEHKRIVRHRWSRYMNGGFDPWTMPAHMPRAQDRMVAAMEFAAFQLGEINQRLARLMELTEEVRNDRD